MTEFNLLDYIISEGIIIIPVLWILGKLMKDSSRLPDWIIPLALLAFSILFTFGYFGISWSNFFQAVLIAGTAVYGHQILKQTTLKDAPVHIPVKDYLYK